ncbi:cytochrome d ubiquinol oxidase subunit II [Algoriphagus halophytocola]|uniref:Cytochrome d ubiquinol oxidase subunit II n=1 Tax=Algoriphagus halophytocola TaxID=2991499 RepID=A0ABY6MLB4_9BACT|nr:MULTISPECIES: cytochrome d ubiquinol oxidase subunit II [unclassified Algoriphagus]UZD23968.1 cytochrome d ubiquinol oxidase subunit II [Algoriphagus sp. TR-M5]WBL41340.1 cytochrome d ubiquinol oxidase subunit II [Algoriphagus sp. TR-M9]
MLYVVIIFLCLSILLYVILGGADFGAGILEIVTPSSMRDKFRDTTYKTIGPIWEANHMWLIISIVILFVGFPSIYTMLSVHLHIPLALMLIGIIGRGTAFVFRHYDAYQDEMQKVYNLIFTYSSFITPLFLGLTFGAAVGGEIDPEANSFLGAYIQPWLNLFSIAVGLFTVAICGFLAAVFLVGEARKEEVQRLIIRKAKLFMVLTFVAGGLVFFASIIDEVPLVDLILTEWFTVGVLFLATAAMILLWFKLGRGDRKLDRFLGGFVVSAILLAFGYHYYPDIIIVKSGENLSLFNSAAPEKAISSLAWALMIGSLFILPALYYLLYSFQKPKLVE